VTFEFDRSRGHFQSESCEEIFAAWNKKVSMEFSAILNLLWRFVSLKQFEMSSKEVQLRNCVHLPAVNAVLSFKYLTYILMNFFFSFNELSNLTFVSRFLINKAISVPYSAHFEITAADIGHLFSQTP
jgi:hypothetical protein